MTSFIHDVLQDLKNKGFNIASITYILPSKRAGLFLKHELAKVLGKTSFSPEIISIESFTEELSELRKENNTELLFHLYSVYSKIFTGENLDSFEDFVKWGQILLQDFNEIDRYLVPQDKLFNYLSAIQELNHWSNSEEKTALVSNYLSFWNSLYPLYTSFQEDLLNQGLAYQGLIYREALGNIESYVQNTSRQKHVFMGFNALNKAEETIIQELLEHNLAEIYWDIDTHFISNPIHDVGLFIQNFKSKWRFYKQNTFDWVANHYPKEKNITTYAVSKNTGQAKHIGHLLDALKKTNKSLENTAVVLADESLLIPVLNSLPEGIQDINITMGLPLNKIPLASLFEKLLNIHTHYRNRFYYKDIIGLLSDPYIKQLYFKITNNASAIIEKIESNNFIYLTQEQLIGLEETEHSKELTSLLFSDWDHDPSVAIKNCSKLIFKIKDTLEAEKNKNLLQLEYLFRFNTVFNELERLNETYNYITNIKTLLHFFDELLNSETLDFQGEPLQGLQIMGVLETRVIDFETVIIASVNEGFLPSGKTNNSFIPYDVKLEYGLPTFKEKDAIYAYHFYHLLQRAKNIHLLYNTEVDALNGGEKSRFITQLEVERIHDIKHKYIAPEVTISTDKLKTIPKTKGAITQLKLLADKGFSPSSLTSYIRNPIDFYYQKVLGIEEYEEVEETIADNTLGTIVHNTLEDFYKPFIGEHITTANIKSLITKIEDTVSSHFKKIYKSGDITSGKNLIIFEVSKRYVYNFLKYELSCLEKGSSIKILGIEESCNTHVEYPELGFKIRLKGKVDRIDLFDGITRIIDYKTGRVEPNHVQVIDWEDVLSDYKKYSKSFQVLMYAYMLNLQNEIKLPVEAGIISFKNLSQGFIKFTKKAGKSTRDAKDVLIQQETLENFGLQLKKLVLEIFDSTIDFVEKET